VKKLNVKVFKSDSLNLFYFSIIKVNVFELINLKPESCKEFILFKISILNISVDLMLKTCFLIFASGNLFPVFLHQSEKRQSEAFPW
jgi:hypothetical protein